MTVATTQEHGQKASKYDWILLSMLGLSLCGNTLLGIGVFRLSGSPPVAGAPARVALGTVLPPLEAERFGGGRESIDWKSVGRPTLVYVFTPSCQWCAKNLDNIKTLTTQLKDRYRVIGVSLDPDVAAYLLKTGLEFPVYVRPSDSVISSYGLGSTPHTLVVAPSGQLTNSWIGAFTGPTQKEVESLFGVKLPGLLTSNQTLSTATNPLRDAAQGDERRLR